MRFLLSLLVLLALLVAVGLPLALLGMPVAPLSVALLAAALFPLARRVRLPPMMEEMMEEDTVEERWPRPVALLARVALLLAVALFLAKVALAPIWSWDHFAIWGLKSRLMVVEGRLDLGFLALPGFERSVTYYPVGLPMLWRLLAFGGLPGMALFKASTSPSQPWATNSFHASRPFSARARPAGSRRPAWERTARESRPCAEALAIQMP